MTLWMEGMCKRLGWVLGCPTSLLLLRLPLLTPATLPHPSGTWSLTLGLTALLLWGS